MFKQGLSGDPEILAYTQSLQIGRLNTNPANPLIPKIPVQTVASLRNNVNNAMRHKRFSVARVSAASLRTHPFF
jgi:hypothetical protein